MVSHVCGQTIGLRQRTIFEGMRSNLSSLVHAIYLFSQKTTGVEISRLTGLTEKVVGNLRGRLPACCTRDIQRNPIRISGNRLNPVQVDESMFHHKQRAHRGRVARRQIWVFGMVNTRYQPARSWMQVVPNRGRNTLVPIINSH